MLFSYLLSQCADEIWLSFVAECRCHPVIFCRNAQMKFGYLLSQSASVIRLSFVAMCRCDSSIIRRAVAAMFRLFPHDHVSVSLGCASICPGFQFFPVFVSLPILLLISPFYLLSISGWVVLTSFLVEDTQLYKRLCPSVG